MKIIYLILILIICLVFSLNWLKRYNKHREDLNKIYQILRFYALNPERRWLGEDAHSKFKFDKNIEYQDLFYHEVVKNEKLIGSPEYVKLYNDYRKMYWMQYKFWGIFFVFLAFVMIFCNILIGSGFNVYSEFEKIRY